MGDRAALIRTIIEFPDDDTPRLVFADLLEENAGESECWHCKGQRFPGFFGGDSLADAFYQERLDRMCPACGGSGRVSNGFSERAEFIRLQCHLHDRKAFWDVPESDSKSVVANQPHHRHYHESEKYTLTTKKRGIMLSPGDFLRFAGEGKIWGRPVGACRAEADHDEFGFGLPEKLPERVEEASVLASMRDRACLLYRENYRKWFGDWPHLQPSWVDDRVVRGFIDTVSCTLANWLAHGKAICREHPIRPHVGMIAEKTPFHDTDLGFWFWVDAANDDEEITDLVESRSHGISGRIVRHFDEVGRVRIMTARVKCLFYRSENDARLALSRACIAWARS